MKKQAKEWLEYATVDLQTAERILGEQHLSRSTAFHCHQAVEKALKSILEDKEARIPKIHDLQKLLSMIREQGIALPIEPSEIALLDGVYIGTRYPTDQGLVPAGDPSLETVHTFYKTARRVLDEVTRVIDTPSGEQSGDEEASQDDLL